MADATPETAAAPPARRSVRAALTAATLVSVGTLLLATFELAMSDWPSGFVLLIVLPLTALLFIGCAAWSATLLLRLRKDGVKFVAPFLVCAGTLLILMNAPLREIALQRNFHWHRADRERIVAQVESGELKPNVTYNSSLIALGDKAPAVSAGNDIVIDQAEKGTYVLFLTTRGLKHTFTGFLHVPSGADPKDFFEFDDKPPSLLVRYDKDWYFVAN